MVRAFGAMRCDIMLDRTKEDAAHANFVFYTDPSIEEEDKLLQYFEVSIPGRRAYHDHLS